MPYLDKKDGVCKSGTNCVGSAQSGLHGTNVNQFSNGVTCTDQIVVSAKQVADSIGGDTENGKRKTVLMETDRNGISISVTDGNRNSISVRFRQAMLAELRLHPFCLACAVNCTISSTLRFV